MQATQQAVLDFMESTITSREGLPAGPLAFHGTDIPAAESIFQHGFAPQSHGEKSNKPDEVFLTNIAERHGYSLPVDRTKSSFFWPTVKHASGFIEMTRECALVLDLAAVEQPMCVADCAAYDSVISYTPFERERALNGPYRDEEEQVALSYIESMQSVSSPDELQQSQQTIARPELIIEGPVPADAIVGVIREPFETSQA